MPKNSRNAQENTPAPSPAWAGALLWPTILFIGGAILAFLLVPAELDAVKHHLIGYPDAFTTGHNPVSYTHLTLPTTSRV